MKNAITLFQLFTLLLLLVIIPGCSDMSSPEEESLAKPEIDFFTQTERDSDGCPEGIRLTWSEPVENIDKVLLSVEDDEGGQRDLGETDPYAVRYYFDPDVATGIQYTYSLSYVKGDLISESITSREYISDFDPASIGLTSSCEDSVVFRWGTYSNIASRYLIERRTDGNEWETLTLWEGERSYSDKDVVGGMSYEYRISSQLTTPVTLTPKTAIFKTLPNPPTDVAAVSDGSSITFTWTDNSEAETGYLIERTPFYKQAAMLEENWEEVGQVSANVSSFVDTDPINMFRNLYRVRAMSDVGDSPTSGEAFSYVITNSSTRYSTSFEEDEIGSVPDHLTFVLRDNSGVEPNTNLATVSDMEAYTGGKSLKITKEVDDSLTELLLTFDSTGMTKGVVRYKIYITNVYSTLSLGFLSGQHEEVHANILLLDPSTFGVSVAEQETEMEITTGEWHDIEFRLMGSALYSLVVDGQLIGTDYHEGDTFPHSISIILSTWATTATTVFLDDVEVLADPSE